MFYVDSGCIDLAVRDLDSIKKLPKDDSLITEHYVQNILIEIETKLATFKKSNTESEKFDSNKEVYYQEEDDLRPKKIARTEVLEENDLLLGEVS